MVYFFLMHAQLILEDGSSFRGIHFGASCSVSGEVVFNTGMTGYPETLTDPSYKGQILVLTYPLIGNYGVPAHTTDDFGLSRFFESNHIHISALIISDYSENYHHWNAQKSLGTWLKEHNIPALYAIDTRALTKKLRESGVMLGKVIIDTAISSPLFDIHSFEDPNKRNLVAEVSCTEVIEYIPTSSKKTVVLIDCGVKNNIIRELLKRQFHIYRVPWDYDFFHLSFDGIFLSNGPGDPKICTSTIFHLQQAMTKNIPIFGICLGNQLLALASGANTYKLKYGHRSQNQPCLEVGTHRCFITSQNHGFAVDEKTLTRGWSSWFVNVNDTTNEGIQHESGRWKSVQFHPEATAGPVDTNYLFDIFEKMLYEKKSMELIK